MTVDGAPGATVPKSYLVYNYFSLNSYPLLLNPIQIHPAVPSMESLAQATFSRSLRHPLPPSSLQLSQTSGLHWPASSQPKSYHHCQPPSLGFYQVIAELGLVDHRL